MRAEARELFVEMVRDCGPGIVRMESSCEMYLNQYLANHPDERQLLSTSLVFGAPEAILEYAAESGYADHLDTLTARFARRAELDPDAARWAIESWAEALGRPAGGEYGPPVELAKVYPDEQKAGGAFTHGAMCGIVAAGGFVGGFLAMCLVPVLLWATDPELLFMNDFAAHQEGYGGKAAAEKREQAVFLFFAAVAVGSGLLGAGAAVGAWLFAGGDHNPWATFSVACGTAFVMVFISTFVPLIILPFKPVTYFLSVFAATYKSAARGGEY